MKKHVLAMLGAGIFAASTMAAHAQDTLALVISTLNNPFFRHAERRCGKQSRRNGV